MKFITLKMVDQLERSFNIDADPICRIEPVIEDDLIVITDECIVYFASTDNDSEGWNVAMSREDLLKFLYGIAFDTNPLPTFNYIP